MSMPQPIHVALIGSKIDQIKAVKKHFRLSEPGIGAAYFSALDATPGGNIVLPTMLPKGRITLWLCLDPKSFEISKELHNRDLLNPRYGRGFYDEIFPEACLLLEYGGSTVRLHKLLSIWVRRIIDAWHKTS